VYTRGGDKGKSSLFSGERRSKADLVFHALGDTDEVSAAVGVASQYCGPELAGLKERLDWVQCRLLDAGAALATPASSTKDPALVAGTAFNPSTVVDLEMWIDDMEEDLPKLTNFVLYSGGKCSTFLHLARTVCRRAERSVVVLVEAGDTPSPVGRFLNRLSDFLFVAARFAALRQGHPETAYKAGTKIAIRDGDAAPARDGKG